MARVKIGDIIEVKTAKGNAYAQYTHKHSTDGALLRVFRGLYPSRPEDIDGVIKNDLQFSIFFPLGAAVNRKIVEVIGNRPVNRKLQDFPLFRAGAVNPNTGKIDVWWLWDGQNEQRIGGLTDEQRKLPIRGICNDTYLIEMLESGWTPETDTT